MKKLLLMLVIMMLVPPPALAGKNMHGAMIVHTDDAHGWTEGVCSNFDDWVPNGCVCLNTRTDKDADTPALIWLIAFMVGSPGVTVVYFGHDHNLPEYSHNQWGFCGPTGSLELPDSGWPNSPATAGNTVAFGSPIVGDNHFPFYYVDVWGHSDAYYCTSINPVGGYAAFVDDSNPPVVDECELFGCVRWYSDAGYNQCIPGSTSGACCFPDGSCEETGLDDCMMSGGLYMIPCVSCDPNPCVPASVPEVSTETVTWGRIKSTYRE